MLANRKQQINSIKFYGLSQQPFVSAWDLESPEQFFLTPNLTKKIKYIDHFINASEQLIMITGEDGLGKTWISKYLFKYISELDRTIVPVLLNVAPVTKSKHWLFKRIADQLNINASSMTSEQFVESLNQLIEKAVKVVLIIDNAKILINNRILEEWRGLINIQPNCKNIFSTILITRCNEYDELIKNQSIATRIFTRIKLQNLSLEETKEYIQFRLVCAGRIKKMFSNEAYQLIHQVTRGIPLRINLLAKQAMEIGANKNAGVISKEVVHDTLTFISDNENVDTIISEMEVNYLAGYIKPGSEKVETLLNSELLKKILLTSSSDEKLILKLNELVSKAIFANRFEKITKIDEHLKKAKCELDHEELREVLNSLKAAIINMEKQKKQKKILI